MSVRSIGRVRRAVTAVLAAGVVTSLIVATPQTATAAPKDFDRPVKTEKPVPTKPLRVKLRPAPKDEGRPWHPSKDHTRWPASGSADVDVSAGDSTSAGELPITVAKAASARATSPSKVRVSLLNRARSEAVGVSGPVFTVSPIDSEPSGPIDVEVDYTDFGGSYGGDWAARLRLVQLPDCAVSQPRKRECQQATPVQADNAVSEQTVSATLSASSTSVYALTADGDSDSGDYQATDLAPSGSWTAGGNSGGFDYQYPLRLPPAAGPGREVSLSYSSQSIDGRTVGKNNQASWVGDGWAYSPGLIERSYQPCWDDRETIDGKTPNNASKKTSDQCWRTENATISLNGTNTTLVKDDATGKWRTQNDANWRVQHVKDSSLNAYDNDGEYWKITTPDGTQYYFGRSPSTAHSTWTAPVFGNHPGEPCHATAFKDSSCSQAWRWMLDRAVDPSGNTTKFYYTREVGHYGAAGDANNRVSYIRGGSPLRIEYGLHEDEPTVDPAGKVEFTLADRCFTSPCYENGEPNAANWPDVPWDRECDQSPCTDTLAPAFFTQKRLSKITTFVRSGTSTFTDVESWELDHVFKQTDVLGAPMLWLQSITHRGLDGTTITDPPVVFSAVGMDNRVDALDNIDAMHRFRIQNIRTESGADIHVTYSTPECKRDTNMPTSPSSNGKRCYPVYWTPAGFEDPTLDWFHKYVVTEIAEVDGTGGSPVVFTKYDYDITGGGTSQLWAYDDNELIKKKHRTYGQWRGYPRVTTRVGDGDPGKGPEPTTTQRFYRGMDGQPLPDGTKRDVSVPDSEGNTASDHEALAGQLRENIQYLGSSIAEASTNTFWTKQTGKHTYSGGSRESYLSGVSVARTRELLDDGVWRRTETRTAYTDEGYPAEVSDLGNMSTASDDLCTRTTYVDNDTAWIRGLPSRVETVSASCTATASRPDDIVTDTTTYYDGSTTFGATPSKGLPTRIDTIDAWEAGAPKYLTTSRAKYDALGRPVESTDAKSRATTTAYTPAGAGPVTKIVTTNPAGHQTTTELDPAYGLPTGVVDPNSKRTDLTYDALGRLGKVWLPGRAKATQTPHLEYSYLIRNDGPLAVTEKRIAPKSNYLTTTSLVDSRYRPRQTQTDSTGGGRLISTTHYNERGQTASVTGPNYTTGAPATTISTVDVEDDRRRITYRYDSLGRVVTEQFWSRTEEQWRTEKRYGGNPNGWQEAVTPPGGGTATATITDARGWVSELRQFHGTSPSGDYDATKYSYTPRGDLKTISLPDGRVVGYGYDLQGRQVTAEDPDKGTSEMEYDATGQITRTVDARGVAVSMTYDDLDRPLARYKGDPATGPKLAEWLYDTRAKGQVSKATTWIDGHAFAEEVLSYSHRYQPQQQTTTIPSALGLQDVAGTYLATTTYLTDGSVNSRSMPAMGGLEREGVANTYDDWGNVVRVIGTASPSGTNTVYLDSAEYTPFGELQQRTLGRSTSPQALQTYLYEEATGRLSRSLFDREGTTVPNVANVSWSYDDAGNVLSLADEPENRPAEADVQCFDHDYLRRMTEAWSQAQKPCASTPEQSAVGGAAGCWTSYRFNTAGSRTPAGIVRQPLSWTTLRRVELYSP